MSTVEMQGLSNLAGQHRGSLLITRLAARRPAPRWHVVCEVCGLQTVVDHARLQNGSVATCPDFHCGQRTVKPRSQTAEVGSREVAARSRDTEEQRRFQREQEQQQ